MPRGRKPSVSSYERRRWLEDLEKGKGITQIAEAAKRDIRVVKRHIEIAQQETVVARAHHDFLMGRLELHQEDLLEEVRRLRQVVLKFPPRSLVPDDPMKRKFHEALKEHAKHLRMKPLLESYEQSAREYHRVHNDVENELAEKEAELVPNLPFTSDLYPWTPRLVEAIEGGGLLGRSYHENKDEYGTYKPSWGEFSLTKSTITKDKFDAVLKAHKKLVSEAEHHLPVVQEHRKQLVDLAELVVGELDVFTIRRLVPGRCNYCPI